MITRKRVPAAYGGAIPGAPPPLHFYTPPHNAGLLNGTGHAYGRLSRARGVPPLRDMPPVGVGMDPADPATFTRLYLPRPGMFGRLHAEAGAYGGVRVQPPGRIARLRRGRRRGD